MFNKCCGCCKTIENKIQPNGEESTQESNVETSQSNPYVTEYTPQQPKMEANPYATEYATENPLPDDYFTSEEHPQHIATAPEEDEWQ
jgi:hypothetical protein